jgi:hypothetical protein
MTLSLEQERAIAIATAKAKVGGTPSLISARQAEDESMEALKEYPFAGYQGMNVLPGRYPIDDKGRQIGGPELDLDSGLIGFGKRALSLPGEVQRGEINPASPEGMRRTTEAAMLMTPMGAAGRVRGALVPKGKFKTTTTKPEMLTAKELKGQANEIYTAVENLPIEVRPEVFSSMLGDLSVILRKAGYAPGMHDKSKGALGEITKYSGRTLTMQDMMIVRRLAKGAKSSIDPDDARIGGHMLRHIDANMRRVPGVEGKLVQADKLWSMAKKSELLDNAVEAAKRTASGFENGLRIEFRKLLKEARKGKLQLSAEETAAMQKVVDGSIPANVLKGLGKLGPAPGGAGNALLAVIASSGAAILGGWPAAAAVAGGGYGSRLGAQAITKGAAERARAIVAGGVPSGVSTRSFKAPGPPTGIPDTMAKALAYQSIQNGGTPALNGRPPVSVAKPYPSDRRRMRETLQKLGAR